MKLFQTFRGLKNKNFWVSILSFALSYYVGQNVSPTWFTEKISLDVHYDDEERMYYIFKGKHEYIHKVATLEDSALSSKNIQTYNSEGKSPPVESEYVKTSGANGEDTQYFQLISKKHFGFWSLLPAIVAILLCWMVKEPIWALLSGVISGALILGQVDITEKIILPQLMTENAAGVLLLYLWLLGALLGVWTKTGAAKAFADFMTKKFVKGPRSAKVVTWCMGVLFFQGGTLSTVLVGTAVRPIADREKVSHEELAYIVDSTASPIASQLAFNAWPGYVQSFIFVAGVPWLATEADRIGFFFKSVPFCFYATLSVFGTLMVAIEKWPIFINSSLKSAIHRARTTGQLDSPASSPLSSRAMSVSRVPKDYTPHVFEFFVPLLVLITTAVGTFFATGIPQVRWGFALALVVLVGSALIRGMTLRHLMEGASDGLKGVVVGSVILLLAITIGQLSKEVGSGPFMVELLGENLPYWSLPVILQILTIIIAFSTGTSWGTYAVAFPLAMPLAYAMTINHNLAHPQFYMMLCFSAVMDGSVFGDQCSPISDTTVLSSMCTGCDLMDHVRTQMPQAIPPAIIAGCLWTSLAIFVA